VSKTITVFTRPLHYYYTQGVQSITRVTTPSGFCDIRVDIGPTVLAREFSVRGQLQHTPKFSSKSVYSFERYPLTNFFANTHTHTNLKIRFLGLSVKQYAYNELNFEFLTVFNYFCSFYENGSNKGQVLHHSTKSHIFYAYTIFPLLV